MRLALPVWNERVAPVFDTISNINIFDDLEFVEEINLSNMDISNKISAIKNANIELFICGAIPYRFEQEIISENVKVISFISGDIKDVLSAYKSGDINNSEFKMPGCRKNRGKNCKFKKI